MSAETIVALVHLGCARNLIDSELILARLAEEGCRVSGDVQGADIAVLNTCSFIGPARAESENAIRSLVARKRRGELSAVVVAGCLVQRFTHQLEQDFPGVDLFAEISDYRALARAVRDLGSGASVPRYLSAGGLREPVREGARLLSTPGSYAYLRISHGCDHTCAFCAIPSIRGPHRSKTADVLVDEVHELVGAGVKELVLVAEDSTAWGRDHGRELPDLVEALAEVEGEHRLRVMYAYPNNFPWRLTTLLREHPRVIPYLDIPVQHVATRVLRRMRRAGSGDQVRRILDRLREEVPGITLRTTLLVGFPGETDEDVAELCEFVRAYGLGRMGAFPYSHEEGTPAFELEDLVPEEIVTERCERVLAARDEVLAASQAAQVGTEVELLVDELHPAPSNGIGAGRAEARLVGRTSCDAPEVDPFVAVSGIELAAIAVGDRIRARIVSVEDGAGGFALVGRPVE